MKTQCPECKTEQDVPEQYVGKEVKCLKCKELFVASEHKPVLTPKPPPQPVELPAPSSVYYPQIIGGLSAGFSILGLISSVTEGTGEMVVECFIWLCLSFILIALGTLINAIYKKGGKK